MNQQDGSRINPDLQSIQTVFPPGAAVRSLESAFRTEKSAKIGVFRRKS